MPCNLPDLLVLDVYPHGVFLDEAGPIKRPLFRRNTTLPASTTRVFFAYCDNQQRMTVDVFEGDCWRRQDSSVLTRFVVDGIPLLPRGAARIRITFVMDADGIFNVSSAVEESTGKRLVITDDRKETRQEQGKGLELVLFKGH